MAAPAKLISTSQPFQDSAGNVVVSGFLRLQLSQNAEVISGGGQVTNQPLWLALTAGGKITSQAIWFNDELSPAATVYSAQLFGSNGCLLIQDFGYWSITGASADLSTMIPAVLGVSYSGAVLLAPTGNQTISTNNLTLGTGDFNVTAGTYKVAGVAPTGTGPLVEQTSPTLVTPNIGAATATSLTNTGDTTLSSGKVVKWNSDSGISRVSAGILAVGNGTQGSTAGTLQVGTIQGATLTGATTGNNILMLNAQGAIGAITGTGADAVIYTYTLPANTIDTNTKSLTIRAALVHTSGTANTSVKINLNGVTLVSGSSGTAASQSVSLEAEILRTGTTTGGVWGIVPNQGVTNDAMTPFSISATGLAWASPQTLTATFSVAATDTWSGIMFTVKQNQ